MTLECIPVHGSAPPLYVVARVSSLLARFGAREAIVLGCAPMPMPAKLPVSSTQRFDEKEFYLDEFRGRTLLFSVPASDLSDAEASAGLAAIARELLANDTRLIVIVGTTDRQADAVLRRLQRRLGTLIIRDEAIAVFRGRYPRMRAFCRLDPHAFQAPRATTTLLGQIWGRLRLGPLFVGVLAAADACEATWFAQRLATQLRVHKLVFIDPSGGVRGADQKQISFMDETMLEALLGHGEAEWAGLADRRSVFEAARAALLGGVASVNVCTLGGLARELFTYTGSGTLFTLEDYCTVKRLGIDDYEEVERLIERGQREGVLKLRTPDEVAGMLANGYGATIGAHHLAGICALETAGYEADNAGEIVGLYTITRFKGEGVGNRLVAQVLADARAMKLTFLFACTTEVRAQAFFERLGFRRVAIDEVPASKWVAYDLQRRQQVAVLRIDL
jgi:N-acetylglutamate synthase-like GNAT family acetyltransferase